MSLRSKANRRSWTWASAECPDPAGVELSWAVAGTFYEPLAELESVPCVTIVSEIQGGSFRLELDCSEADIEGVPDRPRLRFDAPDDIFPIVNPEQRVRFAARHEPGTCHAGDSFVVYHDAGDKQGALLVAGLVIRESELDLVIGSGQSIHFSYLVEAPSEPGELGCRRLDLDWSGVTARAAAHSTTTLMEDLEDVESYRVDVGALRPELDDEACGNEALFEVLVTRL